MPDKAVDRLISLLNSKSCDLRQNAARLLGMIGPSAIRSVPTLIQRIEKEEETQVGQAVVVALSAMGTAALPALIDGLRRQNLRTIPLFQTALFGIGQDAAGELARTLLTSDSVIARQASALKKLSEVAQLLNTSVSNVYALVSSGKLPVVRTGAHGKGYRVDSADLDRFIQDGKKGRRVAAPSSEKLRPFKHLNGDRLRAAWKQQGNPSGRPGADNARSS